MATVQSRKKSVLILHGSEMHASYYGECYEDTEKVSLKRRGCIINTALHNTRVSLKLFISENVFQTNRINYKQVYIECLENMARNREREIILQNRGSDNENQLRYRRNANVKIVIEHSSNKCKCL